MGWVWRGDDEPDEASTASGGGGGGRGICSTKRVVRSQCTTEGLKHGKFVRKCEKTEEVIRQCLGGPAVVLKSDKEYTELDVTNQVLHGSYSQGNTGDSSFELPGFRSDIEAIERRFFDGIGRFLEAAEEMKNSIFGVFGDYNDGNRPSFPPTRRGIPLEDPPQIESFSETKKPDSGDVDLSGLARDV